jgi:uncharacterized protein YbaP (TraB family)
LARQLTLAVLQIQMGGYDPGNLALKPSSTAAAQEAGKQFGYFETVEEQLRFFADMPMELQLADFEVGVRQMVEEPDVLTEHGPGLGRRRPWRHSMSCSTATMRDSSPELYQRLIVDRNIAWIPQIEAALEGSDDALIAVGAGHLPGEQGVIALLEAEGHTVTRQ